MKAGETVHFQQQSNNQKRVASPRLELSKSNSNGIIIALEDGRAGRGDFNDLVVHAKGIRKPTNSHDIQMAAKQRRTFDGLLDLSWLDSDQQLTLRTVKNTDADNRIVVRISRDPLMGYTINNVDQATAGAFRDALRENLIEPDDQLSLEGRAISQRWDLSRDDAGLYAPVLITEDDLVFSFGRKTAADGEQHLKVLGENLFGFEDDLAGRGCDWHYDDVVVEATLA